MLYNCENKYICFLHNVFEAFALKGITRNRVSFWDSSKVLEYNINNKDYLYFADYDYGLCNYYVMRNEKNGKVYIDCSGARTECADTVDEFIKKMLFNPEDLFMFNLSK